MLYGSGFIKNNAQTTMDRNFRNILILIILAVIFMTKIYKEINNVSYNTVFLYHQTQKGLKTMSHHIFFLYRLLLNVSN